MKHVLAYALLSMLLVACSPYKPVKPAPSANNLDVMPIEENLQLDQEDDEIISIPSSESRQMLLGKWYGVRKLKDGGQKEWLTERSADGTYRVDFRFVSADGSARSQSEVGFWGVSGDIYFRIFRGWVTLNGMKPADPTVADHYDAYRIDGLDNDYFSYVHQTRGQQYTVKKMPNEFRLPVTLKNQETEPLTFSY
ncbi:Uncharacterised protein [Zhongshania aliphaticivorans]|uniref:Uncharacterized protein n=1 Tax=Zhongshania aliphaticivorans TaxID=1470434 RepID=A0A5S9PLJ6_9GAMM|nr:hypothetical protein [Zhongshania aliphaticivorans]CAA0105251.1 Uncharacterised protein [Zhongshania aliphaticivorans]CAA0105536.1 Uncharacterised protein [Zhongshania aliphaticivorans]